jgi:class 3 adenylate cyclase/pimeloyl-ACP methyl ester carboxylesterase
VDEPTTKYLDRDGAALAYQVFGAGPENAIWVPEIVGHLDLLWADPHFHGTLQRIGSFSRCAMFQRRGFGLSDPVPYSPTVEQQADDILAVMDAVGMRRATLGGHFGTCAAVALVAARNPERVKNLLLVQPVAIGPYADAAAANGWEPGVAEALLPVWDYFVADWGSGQTIRLLSEALASSSYNRHLMGLMERCSATPAAARAYRDWLVQSDFIDVFRNVRVPTRVLCIPGSEIPEALPRRVAELIDGVEYATLPEAPPGSSLGEVWVPVVTNFLELVNGHVAAYEPDRFLGTVVFTDLVGSTELLNRIGDSAYRDLLEAHERQVRRQVDLDGGRLIKVTGDGTFSVFDGPNRAVRCAQAICQQARELGIEVRAGAHTGEVEHTHGMDISGMTVHIGARVAAEASGGEVLVSRTVRDLAIGSGLTFDPRGERELRGVPGRWDLYAVIAAGAPAITSTTNAPTPTVADRVALRVAQRAPRVARRAVGIGNAWQRRRAKAT